MIYLMKEKLYPTKELCIEEHEYKDENDFIWKIARVQNGFFVRYFGDKYFSDTFFCITTPKGLFKVFNTRNVFFQDASFESFYEFRNILKNGYTDDIWESIEGFLEERFTHDEGMLESEMCDGKI